MEDFHRLDARLSFQFPLSAGEAHRKNRNKDLPFAGSSANVPTEGSVVPYDRIVRLVIDHGDEK